MKNKLIFCKMNVDCALDNVDDNLLKSYIDAVNPFNIELEKFIKREKVIEKDGIYSHAYLYYIVKFKKTKDSIEFIEFQPNRLLKYFADSVKVLREMSNSISILKHSVNIGTARENIIENFLKNILPKSIAYYSGELIDKKDKSSGQLDIIMHSIFSPKLNLYGTINLFPVETVLGVIEVKSNLDKKNLESAIQSYKKVNDLCSTNNIPFIIIGFTSTATKTIKNNLEFILTEKEQYSNLNIVNLASRNKYFIDINDKELNVVENENEILFKLFLKLLSISNSINNEQVSSFDILDYYSEAKTKSKLACSDLF